MTLTPTQIETAAVLLAGVRNGPMTLGELPEECRPNTETEAYIVQDRLNKTLSETGLGQVVGHKIGCTTPVMQHYLGIDHPCAGGVLQQSVFQNEGTYQRDRLCRPGVECELAVTIGRQLPAVAGGYDRDLAKEAVAAVRVSIELVDDRWSDFSSLPTPTLIADNFFNAGIVLGPESHYDPAQLDEADGRMTINGEEVGRGRGSDILGHPLDALAWLADFRAAQGRPIAAGEFVSLGSVVQTKWIEAGDVVDIAFTGIGECRLSVV